MRTDPIFSSWPDFSEEEVAAVAEVLRGNRVNYWTGNIGRQFEEDFSRWVGTQHAIAVMNGTVALELALRGLGIGPGDEVVVTPRSFIASVSCVVNVGATPVFADVDPHSGNLTAETIERVLSPRTRAVVVVHLGGYPADMDAIMALADQYGLKVVEDCAQAHGARYKGRSVGSIGHVGAWSFCQDKIMTTGGEGGMVTTNDEEIWRAMWAYKDHGKSYEAVYGREHPPGFRWLHEGFGTNFRMTEMQAAIGRIQLKKMPEWTALRHRNARVWMEALAPFEKMGGLEIAKLPCGDGLRCSDGTRHAMYKFYAYIRPERLRKGWSRDRIMQEIVDRGTPCFQGSCSEIYLEKAFASTTWRPVRRLPVARRLGEASLMWLIHPTLSAKQVHYMASVSADVLNRAFNV